MAFKVGDLVTPTVRSNKGVTGVVSHINKDGTYQVSFGKNDAGEMDQVDYKENELELYESMKTSLDHMLKAFVKGDLEVAAAHLRECMKGKMKKRVKKLAEDVEYDRSKTRAQASKIADAIKKQFGVDVEEKTGSDGSVELICNKGSIAQDSSSNPNSFTAKNFNKFVDAAFREFREKGWLFTQPQSGKFTIGLPK